MAFLGSKACHEECGVRIMDYLERDRQGNRRSLAFDCINLGAPSVAEGRWATMMDSARVLSGNHTDWGTGRCVTYHHFVISPDPRDDVDLETLRTLAMRWAQEFFGTQMDPGRLGSYQVAIVYHDDNDRGIPHAHVIVNNTDLETGRRLHIDDSQNAELTDRLQEICEESGLSFFGGDAGPRLHEEGRYFTKAERSLLRQGRFSWKQDIANNVAIARRLSRTEGEFLELCRRHGVRVAVRDGDYLYAHGHNDEHWRVGGYRLGRNYTRDAIVAQIAANARRLDESVAKVRENVSRHILEDLFEEMDLVAIVEHGMKVRDVAATLRTNERYGIRAMDDYARRIGTLNTLVAGAPDSHRAGELREQITELEFARSVAARGEFFLGIEAPRAEPPTDNADGTRDDSDAWHPGRQAQRVPGALGARHQGRGPERGGRRDDRKERPWRR